MCLLEGSFENCSSWRDHGQMTDLAEGFAWGCLDVEGN